MAVPRPVLLALIGLALIASAFLMTRGGQSEHVTAPSNTVAKPAVAQKAAPVKRSHRAATRVHAAAPASNAAKAAKPAVRKTAAVATPRVQAPARSGAPSDVLRAAQALGRGDAVVIFFSHAGPADDAGARVAVHALRGLRHVSVFDAGLDQLAAYRPMLSGLGISQIPATVIVRPGHRAVLLQGFVDAGTLRQNVADALR